MSNKEFELILGILLLIASIILFMLEFKEWKKLNKKDFMRKSFKLNILTATFGLFVAGIAGIARYFFNQ